MDDADTPDLDTELADLMDEDGAGPSALADAIVSPPPTTFKRRDDPSLPPYPRGLVLDLALKTAPVAELLVAYKISVGAFKKLTQHPVFRQDMLEVREKLRTDGGFSFKLKLQAQSEHYLSQAWNLIHDPETPASVRSDLIKWSVKTCGLEAQSSNTTTPAEDMGKLAEAVKGMSAQDLELRVLSIIVKRGQNNEGATYDQ